MEIMEVQSTAVTVEYLDEEIYFLKFANLLISHCPKAVRVFFNSEIDPSQLQRELNKNVMILDDLKRKRVITLVQWKLLFPTGGDPSSDTFDITLMLTLLRHLIELSISDRKPLIRAGPMTNEDALSRIKYYRNKIAHSATGRLSFDKFNVRFDSVIEAIGKLCMPMRQGCEKLKTAELTPSLVKIMKFGIKHDREIEKLAKKTDSLEKQMTTVNRTDDILQMLEQTPKKKMITDLKHRLENCDKETLNFGITGMTAVGKSSFINLLLDLKPDDPDYAEEGAGDTTTKVTLYRHPVNNNFTISDMPGFGSIEMPKDKFLKVVNLSDYHFFFIFIDTVFKEDDAWVARKLLQRKIPFCFVRTKLDEYVAREKKHDKGITEDQAIQKLREKLTLSLNNITEFKGAELFLISNIKTKFYLGDLVALLAKIASALPDGKAEAFLFFLPILNPETIEMTFNELKKRVVQTAALSGLLGVVPVKGCVDLDLQFSIDVKELTKELKKYVSVFGLDKYFVSKVPGLKNPFSRKVVRDWKQMIRECLLSKTHLWNLISVSGLGLSLPIVGSLINYHVIYGVTIAFLIKTLEELRDDALTVHRHFKVFQN